MPSAARLPANPASWITATKTATESAKRNANTGLSSTPAVIIGHFAQPGDLSMAPHREADAADAWPYIDCRHAAIVMSCSAWVTSLDSRYVEIRPLRPPSHCFSQMGRFERYRLPLQCGFRDHTRLGMIDEPLPAR